MHRRQKTRAALAALLLGLALPREARAGTLQIDSSGLDCANRRETERQIRRRVGRWFTETQPEVWVVVESRPPEQLVVRVRALDATTERVVSFRPSTDCPQVPRTVALLVRSWLNRRWTKPPPAPEPEPDPAAEPAAAPAVAGEVGAPAAASGRLAIGLAAGLFAQPADGRRAALIAAGADHALSSRWGLGLEARYEASVGKDWGRGRVAVAIWSLAPVARLRLMQLDSAHLDALAGPGVSYLNESSSGYSQHPGNWFVDATLLAAARWRQRLVGSLWGSLEVEGRARAMRETLSVGNLGPVMSLPRARLSAAVGLAWEPL